MKVDLNIRPPRLRPMKFDLWLAWWEDHDGWEGHGFYRAADDADLHAAQWHAAFDYVSEEHGWYADEPDSDRPALDLSWTFESNRWELLDNGKFTGVVLSRVRAEERAE